MENRRILVDTSILIEFLRKHKKQDSKLWNTKEHYDIVCISSVTVFEIFLGAKSDRHRSESVRLIGTLEVMDFGMSEAISAAQILQELKTKNKVIEFRDVMIAAQALVAGIPLSTINRSHFERIDKLELVSD